MAGRKRAGRTVAEKAFTDLLKAELNAVGDVGEEYEKWRALMLEAEKQRQSYETTRAEVVARKTISSAQFDSMGYKRSSALTIPALPGDEAKDEDKSTSPGRAGKADSKTAPEPAPSPGESGSQSDNETTDDHAEDRVPVTTG